MAYDVVFLDRAKQDISDMIDTLIDDYPDAAVRKYEKIIDAAKRLQDNPYLYEEYRFRKSYRRIVIEDYLVFYQVDDEKRVVKIYRILYYRRNVKL